MDEWMDEKIKNFGKKNSDRTTCNKLHQVLLTTPIGVTGTGVIKQSMAENLILDLLQFFILFSKVLPSRSSNCLIIASQLLPANGGKMHRIRMYWLLHLSTLFNCLMLFLERNTEDPG